MTSHSVYGDCQKKKDYQNYENNLARITAKMDAFLEGLIDEHRGHNKDSNTMIDHLLSLQ